MYAWGQDEADILIRAPHVWFKLGLTIVDSIDTLLLAGLHEEYAQARHWVANHLTFHDGEFVQFFEVNIRILGGLLSAYYLSGGDELYLSRAHSLADRCARCTCAMLYPGTGTLPMLTDYCSLTLLPAWHCLRLSSLSGSWLHSTPPVESRSPKCV